MPRSHSAVCGRAKWWDDRHQRDRLFGFHRTPTEISQGVSETAVQKVTIQMQCLCRMEIWMDPYQELSSRLLPLCPPSLLQVFHSSQMVQPILDLFLKKANSWAGQDYTDLSIRIVTLLITQEPKPQMPRPGWTVLRPQRHSWEEPKAQGSKHSSALAICYLNSEPPTSS